MQLYVNLCFNFSEGVQHLVKVKGGPNAAEGKGTSVIKT